MSNRPAPTRRTTPKTKAKANSEDPTDRIVMEIAAGRCDARLHDVATAIGVRIQATATTFGWRFQFDGVDVSELDVTLDEWARIQRVCGVPWTAINPEGNLDQILGVGTVLLETRGGLTADEAQARMGALTLNDMPGLFTTEQRTAPFDSPN